VKQASPISDRLREILRPYAANWSGTLGRGDVLIPQREISQVIDEIVDAVRTELTRHREASDAELFEALMDSRRTGSVQDQMAFLRNRFKILYR
jgi:hypothetical protein